MSRLRPPRIYGTGEKVILSVEDDISAYVLLEFGFQEVGGDFRIYRVEDGEQALAFLQRSGAYQHAPRPHLILLNLNLPGLNGYDVLQAIKKDPGIERIPCVVFTSSQLDQDQAKCLALGARDFITKPIDFDDFLHMMRHVCTLVAAA